MSRPARDRPAGAGTGGPWLRHLGRRVLMLLLLVALAVPALAGSRQVRLQVAGNTEVVRSYAATVGDLLERRDVRVAAGDQIRPAPTTPLEDGLTVEVVPAVEVRLEIAGGATHRLRAPVETVGGALRAAPVDVGPGAEVTPARTTPITGPTHIEVRPVRTVTVSRGDDQRVLETTAVTVGEALRSAGIQPGPLETVRPGPDARLPRGGGTVEIRRASFRSRTRTVELSAEEQRRRTDDLLEGETRVVQEGSDGQRRDTYRMRYVNGRLVERTRTASRVVEEPRPRVVAVGTREPAPEPASAEPATAAAGGDSVWYRLAECESGGRWDLDGTYDGGLQFHPDTWRRYKPAGYPAYAHQASPAQQIAVGRRLQAARGWDAWPHCAEELGLR